MTDFWATAGVSALVATLFSAAINVWGTSRGANQKSVIEQRQRWRDSLRELIPALLEGGTTATRQHVRDAVVLHLNPYRDGEVVTLIDAYLVEPSQENRDAVMNRFQELLKRDWERAKIEAKVIPWWADRRAGRVVAKQRKSRR